MYFPKIVKLPINAIAFPHFSGPKRLLKKMMQDLLSSGIYYMGNYSESKFASLQYLSKRILIMNGIVFEREFPETGKVDPSLALYLGLQTVSELWPLLLGRR